MGTNIPDTHIGELSPGSVGRRWIPDGGEKKHRERIHRDSKFADNHKKLPFTFSKPKKSKASKLLVCDNCGAVFCGNVNTYGVICRECGTFSKVSDYIGD